MRVRVTRATDNNWYKVGEEYQVKNYTLHRGGADYYPLIDDTDVGIVPEHCEVIQEQPKFPFMVRCVDNTNAEYELVVGEIYTVSGYNGFGDYFLRECNCSWGKNRFEIVNGDDILGPQEYIPDPVEEKRVIDAHYSFNYTLTDKDRETGAIKVDPYFVAKQWRLGSKDDTGVLFHCLKNISRYSDKNTKEREITALHLQVKRLAELEGVKLD
jgi:hypothetical protein